jgi:arginyl-tRNA synthetase
MVRPSQDAKFGDYQANCAMPLAKRLGRPSREIGQSLADLLQLADDEGRPICDRPEVAGPGFVNLRLTDAWLARRLEFAALDDRVGVPTAPRAKSYVVDFSGPNVAKPMHVGHIRSTVIGDSLIRTLSFLGHKVVGDNHLGDWGVQFGMIIYGYKHFVDAASYRASPVDELARLYRQVNALADFQAGREELPKLRERVAQAGAARTRFGEAPIPADPKAAKKHAKDCKELETTQTAAIAALRELERKQQAAEGDAALVSLAAAHPDARNAALTETVKLHAGDATSLALWKEFMPPCLAAIDALYRRLHVTFDVSLGESFYHDRLADVVADLERRGLATASEGATCVFLGEGQPPMIVRKKDGAFLYSTTDLATIQYRLQTWSPDAILYVVDHRQSLHFNQLFQVARRWGFDQVELVHVAFGTVLGADGKPYKTRSGDTVGLAGLLDEAVSRALVIVSENDDARPDGPELSPERRQEIAETIGIAAIKYADLAHNRTSDYVFSYDKMLAYNGNTATYMQYAYARVRSIFRKGDVDPAALRRPEGRVLLTAPAERSLGLALLRFADALDNVVADYRPNHLTAYVFELANVFSTFFEQCPVLKAETADLRDSRLRLSDLTARTLKQCLELLGIEVVEQM